MVAESDIKNYCDAIAAAFRPKKIILFGSHVYGQPHCDSDVDVLVVLPRRKWRTDSPSLEIRQRVSAKFPVDILVRAPGELRERLKAGDWMLREIVGKGRVMYERTHR